ncbi:unnamed protein product [Cuscuta campestris]|uniref:Uncharacterized protein n=1 Tax=Cuscuta campestris TaxID=132261 RepID=A0A484L6K2_9ASTE|nr:unnamed protein product [Cuscuta campestris]
MRTKLSGYEDKKKIDGYTPGVLEYKAKYAAAFFITEKQRTTDLDSLKRRTGAPTRRRRSAASPVRRVAESLPVRRVAATGPQLQSFKPSNFREQL